MLLISSPWLNIHFLLPMSPSELSLHVWEAHIHLISYRPNWISSLQQNNVLHCIIFSFPAETVVNNHGMIHSVLFICCAIILVATLLLSLIFCFNIFSCHERHRDKLTKQNWYSSTKRGIFSVHYFERSHRVQILDPPTLDEEQNLARPQQLPNQPNLAQIHHPRQQPSSLYSQNL